MAPRLVVSQIVKLNLQNPHRIQHLMPLHPVESAARKGRPLPEGAGHARLKRFKTYIVPLRTFPLHNAWLSGSVHVLPVAADPKRTCMA
jgi:hypothetical protein